MSVSFLVRGKPHPNLNCHGAGAKRLLSFLDVRPDEQGRLDAALVKERCALALDLVRRLPSLDPPSRAGRLHRRLILLKAVACVASARDGDGWVWCT